MLLASFAPTASAVTGKWPVTETAEGNYLFKNEETGVEREVDRGEFEAWKHEVEATNAEISDGRQQAFEEIVAKNKAELGATPGESEAAEDVVASARGEGAALPEEVAKGMDVLGESGGVLDLAAAGTLIGALTLAPTAFDVGVEIGNGLDQLFGFPKLELGIWEKETSESSGGHEGCTIQDVGSTRDVDEVIESGDKENVVGVVELPAGYYADCETGDKLQRKTDFQGTSSCKNEAGESPAGDLIPSGEAFEHTREITEHRSVGEYSTSCKEPVERTVVSLYAWYDTQCKPNVSGWLATSEPGDRECPPVGAPDTGGLPSSVEKTNKEHGLPEKPETTAPPLPGEGTKSVIPTPLLKQVTEDHVFREFVEAEGGKTDKAMHEEEVSELEKDIPMYGQHQPAREYEQQLEAEGFSDVTVKTVGESDENPETGPEDVARVYPQVGTRVQAGAHVEVDENPKTAPAPTEPKAPSTGEMPPGIKTPSFGVLCNKFPFGVPCWAVETIKGWSATGEAPKTEIPIDKKHIAINFSVLEPAMEIIRPVIVIALVVGIVWTFFALSTGGGGAPDTSGDGE